MNTRIEKPTIPLLDRKGERGAALVTVMMISFLLLVASIALILESSLNTANVTDATAEEQAYYAAESGIQSVVDTLRHTAVAVPPVDASATPLPNGDPALINRLDYRKAVDRRFSNASCDPSASIPTVDCGDPRDSEPNGSRMSRWIRYTWGTDSDSPDRVVLGDPATYSPLSGFAYSVEVSDPDNTSGTVSFTTSGYILAADGSHASIQTYPGSTSDRWTTVEYIPPGPQTLNVETGQIGNIGQFLMTNGPDGPGIFPTGDAMVRFKVQLSFSQPAGGAVVIRGYLLPPSATPITNTDSTTCARPTMSYLFDSQNFRNFGSLQSITNGGCQVEEQPSNSPQGPNGTFLAGWQVQPAASGQPKLIELSVSRPEPKRLLIRSTGYGPRGAKKILESIIQKNYFDGMGAPSPLTLIGPTCTKLTAGNCTVRNGIPAGVVGVANGQSPESQITFVPGTSNPIIYTGRDATYRLYQPPIGVTNDVNLGYIRYVIANDFGGKVFGSPENVAAELPPWLQNPRNVERTIQLLREVAQASGTYYGPTTNPPNNAVFGSFATGTGITVIDSNGGAELNHYAGGLLVVTKGGLGLRGRYGFRGVMLITGPDGLYRLGGGGANCAPNEVCGRLQGNMIVAPYNTWSLNTCMPDTTTPQFQDKLNCFLSPRYDINGGGKSELMGNEQDVGSALTGLGNFVKGVAEK